MAHKESTSSKLIARLREVSQGVATPLGFGRAQAQRIPPMLLVVRLARNDASLAEAAVVGGADALVCHLFGSRPLPTRPPERGDHDGEASPGPQATPSPAATPVSEPVEPTALAQSSPMPTSSAEAPAPAAPSFGGIAEERTNIEAIVKVAGGRPVGVVIGTAGAITAENLDELVKLGVDFVVVHPHRAPVALLSVEALGHVVQFDREYPSGPIRGINELGVDAVELTIGRPDSSLPQLTIHDLANFRQLIDSIRRPVLVPTAWSIQTSDLKFLRDIGIEALVLTPESVGEGADSVRSRVAEYRQAIDKLPPPIGRGRALEGRRVVLPRVKGPTEGEEEEEGDDDE